MKDHVYDHPCPRAGLDLNVEKEAVVVMVEGRENHGNREIMSSCRQNSETGEVRLPYAQHNLKFADSRDHQAVCTRTRFFHMSIICHT